MYITEAETLIKTPEIPCPQNTNDEKHIDMKKKTTNRLMLKPKRMAFCEK